MLLALLFYLYALWGSCACLFCGLSLGPRERLVDVCVYLYWVRSTLDPFRVRLLCVRVSLPLDFRVCLALGRC